jgi:hypothetical protein
MWPISVVGSIGVLKRQQAGDSLLANCLIDFTRVIVDAARDQQDG